MITHGLKEMKINAHDPRCQQKFLQFSNDMHRWQEHINDYAWWQAREQECHNLFKQHGYDLHSGLGHCLIGCHLRGWKGVAGASTMLANGFFREHPSCWPPQVAQDLRRQILERFIRQVLPQIYALPAPAASTPVLVQLRMAIEQLLKQAERLQLPQQHAMQQLSSWLLAQINTVKKQDTAYVAPPLNQEQLIRKRSPLFALIWGMTGALTMLAGLFIYNKLDEPDVLRLSQRIWPGNPLVEQWVDKHKKSSAMLLANSSTQHLNLVLDNLEQRLLDAEQKRKPYMTISELKTIIYQMRELQHQQESLVENQLNHLLIQREKQQPVSDATLYALSWQIESLKSRLLLASDIVKTPVISKAPQS